MTPAPAVTVPLAVDAALSEVLRPGQDIVIGQAFGAPHTLIEALPRHRERLQGSRIFVGMLIDDFPELPETELHTFFPSGPLGSAAALQSRGVRYERRSLLELADGLLSGNTPVDVVLGQGTPARDGRHSLGVTVDFLWAAAERADVTVLETGAAVPWTGAASTIHADRVIAVEAGARPAALQRRPSARDAALAREVERWIPDAATLQLGLGPWAAALAACLTSRRGLRVHSGFVSDWLADLDLDGPAVAAGAGGSPQFYAWLEETERVALTPANVTHDPARLASLPNLRAVNSVLEVDLLGRANSEVGRNGRRGGVAGLSDFARAAARSPDGLSIIALPAAAGEHSRIVTALETVSLAEDAVDVIVTEYGSADLRGLGPRERAAAIAAVAAPEHRRALTQRR